MLVFQGLDSLKTAEKPLLEERKQNFGARQMQELLKPFLSNPDAIALLKSGETLTLFSGTVNKKPFTYLTTTPGAGLGSLEEGGKAFCIYAGKLDQVVEVALIPGFVGGEHRFGLKNGSAIHGQQVHDSISAVAYISTREPEGEFGEGKAIRVELNPPNTAFEKFSVQCKDIDLPKRFVR